MPLKKKTTTHSHENKNPQNLKNPTNDLILSIFFYSSEVDFNKFKLKQIKNISFVPNTMLHAVGRARMKKIQLIPKKLTVEQRWWTHTQNLVEYQALCNEFSNPATETVLWERKEKKVNWHWKMRRLLVRTAPWTGPKKMRGHPNRWDCGRKDIETGTRRSPGMGTVGRNAGI